MTGRWYSPVTPVSSPNKTDRHDITEILPKVAIDTINLTKPLFYCQFNGTEPQYHDLNKWEFLILLLFL